MEHYFLITIRVFRKKIPGGLAIIYSSDSQATLRNHTGIGTFTKSGAKDISYGAIGVSEEGQLIYHIMVDKDGKKRMLYPQKSN